MPNFEKLTEAALHEGWEGRRLRGLLWLYHHHDVAVPVDLDMYATTILGRCS